jgi:predicted PurR-regulated permease PerM
MDSMDKTTTTNGLLTAMVILMALAALYFAKDVILPAVLGFMLALTLGPWVGWLSRRNVPAPLSAVVLVGGFGTEC